MQHMKSNTLQSIRDVNAEHNILHCGGVQCFRIWVRLREFARVSTPNTQIHKPPIQII